MGRTRGRLSCLCARRGAQPSIQLGSPQPKLRPSPAASEAELNKGSVRKDEPGRRIMVAVDSETEGKAALHWALSHLVQSSDTLVILSVAKPTSRSRRAQSQKETSSRRNQMLVDMQNLCSAIRPETKVELSVVEGRERGPKIVEEARKQMASLLVLGQKRRWVTWRLIAVCGSNMNRMGGGADGVVDYCIQNAPCMTLAMRRKSRRSGGGYLITTKHHKNFWLLA